MLRRRWRRSRPPSYRGLRPPRDTVSLLGTGAWPRLATDDLELQPVARLVDAEALLDVHVADVRREGDGVGDGWLASHAPSAGVGSPAAEASAEGGVVDVGGAHDVVAAGDCLGLSRNCFPHAAWRARAHRRGWRTRSSPRASNLEQPLRPFVTTAPFPRVPVARSAFRARSAPSAPARAGLPATGAGRLLRRRLLRKSSVHKRRTPTDNTTAMTTAHRLTQPFICLCPVPPVPVCMRR